MVRRERQLAPSQEAALPRHVAIMMDGNGRWAQARGLSRLAGHRAGTENLRRVIEHFSRRGIPYLTLYVFSTENWRRPRQEINGLFRLLARTLDRELDRLHANGVRLAHLGRLDGIPEHLRRRIEDAIDLTRHNDRITVSIAFNYGGRAELVDAARRVIASRVSAGSVTAELFSRYLYAPDLPEPDLIIRTGGDQRLSNFLLWQSAYSELYWTPIYWPDFDVAAIEDALAEYAARRAAFRGGDHRQPRSESFTRRGP